MKILIVEDEHNSRIAMEMFLGSLGHEVASACTLSNARELLESFAPEVMICDWQLEHNQGEGVTLARDAVCSKCHPAIVFITGDSVDDLRADTADLDVVDYLAKPFGMSRLDAVIQRLSGGELH